MEGKTSQCHNSSEEKKTVQNTEKNLLDWAPLCTPPMPPVTNTGIPVLLAAIIVLDTVVAPVRPCKVQMLSYNTFCNKISAATIF